jgi:hypothetical protein
MIFFLRQRRNSLVKKVEGRRGTRGERKSGERAEIRERRKTGEEREKGGRKKGERR